MKIFQFIIIYLEEEEEKNHNAVAILGRNVRRKFAMNMEWKSNKEKLFQKECSDDCCGFWGRIHCTNQI